LGEGPIPVIDLRAGSLYNLAISLLVFLGSTYAAWAIFSRGKKTLSEKSFSLFLAAIGTYWLLVGAGNLFAWYKILSRMAWIAFLVKILSILPLLFLAYFFCSEIFANKTNVRRTTFLYLLISAVYLGLTITQDLTQSTITYWGVQWQVSPLPELIYLVGLLFPLSIASVFLIIKAMLISFVEKKESNLTLYFAGIIFIFLEYLQMTAVAVTWQRLLVRLFYILIAFGAYLYFVGRIEEKRFIPREEQVLPQKKARIPFFMKLLFLFVLLAIVPITISSFLMFVSFREIIDLYVYQPLLWNLKASREALILALNHVQIQSLFLMMLTGLLVLVVSALVSRAIAESLKSISVGMERVTAGDFSFKIRSDTNDEIGDVINYFNEMSAEIKRSREIMERWNRELEAKVVERTEDLRTLYNISKEVGSSLDLELLISRAIERLLPVMKAELYAVLVPDERGKFSARIGRGIGLKDLDLEEGRGLLGEALQKKEIVFTENVPGDPRCQEDLYRNLGIKTMVVTPLRAKGKTQGILIIGTKEERKYAGERGISLLATIADQLAIAIENVGIYEREKEAVARLTELDRLKNEFISMVSHELRTPVTSVDGYISLFLTGAAGSITEDQKRYLTIVRENDQRLLTLINRLLDFSRIETGRFSIERKLVSIHDVIRLAVKNIKPQIEKKKAEIKMKLEAKNINFMGDQSKMEEVFVNLFENALKFDQEGKPPLIEVSTKDAGDFIRIEVADNGIGIEKEHLGKIFNKFYQVEETLTRRAGGVGLGLALAKEIIGNHHGEIWAESGGGNKGSKFIFTIPVAEKV